MDRLDQKSAIGYLLQSAAGRNRSNEEGSAAVALAEKLGCLPLALELTAAHVSMNRLAFSDLLADWQRREREVLKWYDPRTGPAGINLILLRWKLNFAVLESRIDRLKVESLAAALERHIRTLKSGSERSDKGTR